jgi:hypothetical protein
LRYAIAAGEVDQAANKAGTVMSDLHLVLRACSKIFPGDGVIGSAVGEIAVGGYTAVVVPARGCQSC